MFRVQSFLSPYLSIVLISLFLASCASKSPDCTVDRVRQAGVKQALDGHAMDFDAISCGGGDNKKAFEAGYLEGKKRYCAPVTAELKGLSRSAIYKAIEDGRLKSRRVLGHVALSRTEVLKWQPSPTTGWPKGKSVSEEAKAKISESQKQRWKQRKAE